MSCHVAIAMLGRILSGRLFQSLGAKYEKALPPLVDFAILGTTKSPEFCEMVIFQIPVTLLKND